MSDEVKKPEAGEWWFSADMFHRRFIRRFIVGRDSGGGLCYQDFSYKTNCFRSDEEFSGWHHEPDCDSWDWKPEVFPQWYRAVTSITSARFHRRDSKTKTVGVDRDGSEWSWDYEWNESDRHLYVQLTKEQAEALLTPVESEDDWVTQDVVPARLGIDKCWWGDITQPVNEMWTASSGSSAEGKSHGYLNRSGIMLSVFCRRRDLPKTQTVNLKLFVDADAAKYQTPFNVVCSQNAMTGTRFTEIKSDSNGGLFIEVPV
jgi:hypothetical protein